MTDVDLADRVAARDRRHHEALLRMRGGLLAGPGLYVCACCGVEMVTSKTRWCPAPRPGDTLLDAACDQCCVLVVLEVAA